MILDFDKYYSEKMAERVRDGIAKEMIETTKTLIWDKQTLVEKNKELGSELEKKEVQIQ